MYSYQRETRSTMNFVIRIKKLFKNLICISLSRAIILKYTYINVIMYIYITHRKCATFLCER